MPNFREFFLHKPLILLRPTEIEVSAKEFISTYASYMESIGIVGKGPSGHAMYPSRTAPVTEEHTQLFEDLVSLSSTLDIHTAASMDFYTDAWFAKDPKYHTIAPRGESMPHQICPNRNEFWEYGAELVGELGSYPIDEILLFGAGFIRDHFCFCDRCRSEFAPLVDQEPSRLTYEYIAEDEENHAKWHDWRAAKVNEALKHLQEAARDVDEKVERETPLRISVEVLLDPETGFSEGARGQYGYDYKSILEITGNILINLYPWSPIIPDQGSSEYDELVESLYFTKEFQRRGGMTTLFRWGVSSIEQLLELKALAKDADISRVSTTFSYPSDYSTRRESAIGNY